MKIAIDCHTLEVDNWAGKEQFLLAVITHLAKREIGSYQFILYFRNFPKKLNKFKEFPSYWRIKKINLPTPLWQLFVLFHAFFGGVKIFFCPCAYLLPALNFFIPQVMIVYDLTTFLPATKKTHKKMTRWREKLLLRLAVYNSKKVAAISINTKNDLLKLFKTDKRKVSVVYGAPDDRFRVIDGFKIKEKLFQYRLPDKFILSVGTLEPRKNLVNLIEAYHYLIHYYKIKEYKLVVVGKKGWYYEEIFQKVVELNLEKDIKFVGYVPDEDLPYLYNLATCFVYPSIYEGFGLPPAEAMACGCPVITSNVSSLPEVVGEAAITVNPRSIQEISRALYKVLTSDNLRQKMRQKGLKQAKKFSWNRSADKILDLFKEVK